MSQAIQLLKAWGLLYAAGQLRDVIRRDASGENQGGDDESLMALYVERTPGYYVARPVLAHVYARFLPVGSYDPRLPGERLEDAINRQGMHSAQGLPLAQIGPWVHDRFVLALERRLEAEPFMAHAYTDEHVLPLSPAVDPKHRRYLEQVAKQRRAELRMEPA